MPKAPSSRIPYHLSLPSPTGLPPNATFYRRSSPATPSPPGWHPPRGLLLEFANARSPIVKQEYAEAHFPLPGVHLVPKIKPDLATRGNDSDTGEVFAPLQDSVPLKSECSGGATDFLDEGIRPISDSDLEQPLDNSASAPSAHVRRRFAAPSLPRPNSKTMRLVTLRSRAATARRQLRHAQVEIEELRAHIGRLEKSERRMKSRVAKEKELTKDTVVEAEEAKVELLRAEERIDEMDADMTALRRKFNQYRGWWLTENLSLKTVLKEVPKRKWDAGLEAIAASSHNRFMSYSGSGSN